MNKKIVLMVILIAAVILGAGVPAASAQECNGAGALQGTFSVDPNSGPAGSSVLVSGQLAAPTAELETGVGTTVPPIGIYWLETGWSDAQLIATLQPDDQFRISGTITVPAGAAPGPHSIGFWDMGIGLNGQIAQNPACVPFTVTEASVQQTAYAVASRTTMPTTGSILLIPAAGLIIGATCLLLLGRSRGGPTSGK